MTTPNTAIQASIAIAVISDADGRLQGYQAKAYPRGYQSCAALPLGPVCATRHAAAAYMSVRHIATIEGGYSIEAVDIERVY